MSLTAQLSTILIGALFLWIVGFLSPDMSIQANFRLFFAFCLIAVLSQRAVLARFPLAMTRFFTSKEEGIVAASPAAGDSRQRNITRGLNLATHPLPISLLLIMMLLLRVMPLREVLFTDEAIWSYVANAWVHFDLPPYAGAFENKTPGIFYLFSLGELLFQGSIWFPRVAGILATVVTGFGIYRITRLFSTEIAARLAMLFFALTSTASTVDGQWPALTESFMLMCTSWGIYTTCLAPHSRDLRRYMLLLCAAGCLFGAAIAFKQTAIFTVLGALSLYLFLPSPYRKGVKSLLRDSLLVLTGIAVTTLLSIVPLLLSRVTIQDYLHGAWLILLQPGSSAPSFQYRVVTALWALDQVDLQLYLPLLLLVVLLYRPIRQQVVPLLGLVGWLCVDVLAANASGSYFAHQMRQILPAMAVLGGIGLNALLEAHLTIERLKPVHQVMIFAVILLLWWPSYGIRLHENTRDLNTFLRQTARKVQTYTSPGESVYVFTRGDGVAILTHSQQRAASRYFTQYFFPARGVEDSVQRDLNAAPPQYILVPIDGVMSNLPRRKVPAWVYALLDKSYVLQERTTYPVYIFEEWVERGYDIYRRQ